MIEYDFDGIDFTTSAAKNNATLMDFYARLKLVALTVYEWRGLPETCNARFLEMCLYANGICVMFKEDRFDGLINTMVTPSDRLNIYYEPLKYRAYSVDYQKELKPDECEIIRNNILCRPTSRTIMLFAQRLYNAQRSMDANVEQQKFPVVFTTTKNQLMTMKNVMKDYQGNVPLLLADKNLGLNDSVKALQTGIPYVADKLMLAVHEIWNECMTFLGIANANTDKKERLIVDEANANNEMVDMCSQTMLFTRQEFATKANEKWGLNVTVRKRTLDEISEMMYNDSSEKDGEEDG